METVRRTLTACRDLGVRWVTLYAFSSENWSRPRAEVQALMRLLREYLEREVDELDENGVRLETIGHIEDLPKYAREALEAAKRRLAGNDRQVLILALNYGSRREVLDMVRTLAGRAARGEIRPEEIDDEMVRACLHTAPFPDPDLLIRTSGEMRVSNFLLYQIAYTEIVVTPVLWPDFSREDLLAAIREYAQRERRFGGVGSAAVR
jgi:undecaprenyl diphosphate synthase